MPKAKPWWLIFQTAMLLLIAITTTAAEPGADGNPSSVCPMCGGSGIYQLRFVQRGIPCPFCHGRSSSASPVDPPLAEPPRRVGKTPPPPPAESGSAEAPTGLRGLLANIRNIIAYYRFRAEDEEVVKDGIQGGK